MQESDSPHRCSEGVSGLWLEDELHGQLPLRWPYSAIPTYNHHFSSHSATRVTTLWLKHRFVFGV